MKAEGRGQEAEGLMGDDKLPQGWVNSKLGYVCSKPQYGWTSPASPKGELKYLRTTDISSGQINWNTVPYCSKVPEDIVKYLVKENDILVSRAGSVGISYRIDKKLEKAVFASYLIRFKPLEKVVIPKYVEFYLKSHFYWRSISEFTSGIAVPNVNGSKLANLDIPIPPLNEQKRIVAKLEKLLAKVNESCDRISRIPTILKRFRQSVLAAACSGRLTADWRAQHPDVETAEELLKKDKRDEMEEILQSWCFVSVGDVIKGLKYGTSKKCSYDKQSHPVLRIPNVVQGVIDCSDLKYTELSDKEYETLKLIAGDILMIRSNGSVSLIGKTAMIKQSEEGFAYAGYLIRLRPNLSLIDPSYLNYYLSSYEIRIQIELPARSTSGVNNINSTEVKNLVIAIPPLEEQEEIVKRVEALFRKCDLIEQRYLKAKAYTDKLTQSILAKAFRGELVPQDPKDEPAEALLERIRADKAFMEKSSKG